MNSTTSLQGVSFAIDRCVLLAAKGHKVCSVCHSHRFHEVNHKCTEYSADRLEGLVGVNSEAAEQLFRWLSHYRFQCGHMNEETYRFFLYNVMEAHNRSTNTPFPLPLCPCFFPHRWVLSCGDPSAITRARPCSGTHVHDPTNVLHWVCHVEQHKPLAILTAYMDRVAQHLRREQMRHLQPDDTAHALNPFADQGIVIIVGLGGCACLPCVGAKKDRSARKRAYQSKDRPKPKRLAQKFALLGGSSSSHLPAVKKEEVPQPLPKADRPLVEEQVGDITYLCVSDPSPSDCVPIVRKERKVLSHAARGFTRSELPKVTDRLKEDLGKFGMWEAQSEDQWFQQLRQPPCGLQQNQFDNIVGVLLRGLKGNGPMFVNKVVKQVGPPPLAPF